MWIPAKSDKWYDRWIVVWDIWYSRSYDFIRETTEWVISSFYTTGWGSQLNMCPESLNTALICHGNIQISNMRQNSAVRHMQQPATAACASSCCEIWREIFPSVLCQTQSHSQIKHQKYFINSLNHLFNLLYVETDQVEMTFKP